MTTGAAFACDAGDFGQGFLFADNGDQYNVAIYPDEGAMAKRIDTAAKVLPKLRPPDG